MKNLRRFAFPEFYGNFDDAQQFVELKETVEAQKLRKKNEDNLGRTKEEPIDTLDFSEDLEKVED